MIFRLHVAASLPEMNVKIGINVKSKLFFNKCHPKAACSDSCNTHMNVDLDFDKQTLPAESFVHFFHNFDSSPGKMFDLGHLNPPYLNIKVDNISNTYVVIVHISYTCIKYIYIHIYASACQFSIQLTSIAPEIHTDRSPPLLCRDAFFPIFRVICSIHHATSICY